MKKDKELKKIFKNRLRQIRKIKNLSQEEFSSILEIPVRTLKSYEQEERLPSMTLFIALHDKLNLNLNWFTSGQGSMFFIPGDKNPLEEFLYQKYNLSERDFNLIKTILIFLDKT